MSRHFVVHMLTVLALCLLSPGASFAQGQGHRNRWDEDKDKFEHRDRSWDRNKDWDHDRDEDRDRRALWWGRHRDGDRDDDRDEDHDGWRGRWWHRRGDADRDDDRDTGWWSRGRHRHGGWDDNFGRTGRPPGWDRGRKTGWGGCDVPPGQVKKVGCRDFGVFRHGRHPWD